MRYEVEFTFRPIDRWPQEPTRFPSRSRFRSDYPATLRRLREELGRIGVTRCYIAADVTESEIRNDGQLKASARPRTQRIIVAGASKFGPIMLPCDTFDDWRANLHAIALSLAALRAVDRYGVTKRGEQYRGLKQLTAGDGPINSDEAALFVARESTTGGVDDASLRAIARNIRDSALTFDVRYKAAAKRLHPDVAGEGSRKAWDRLQVAAMILRDHHATAARA